MHSKPQQNERDMMRMEEMMMMGNMGPRGRMMQNRMMIDDDSDEDDMMGMKMMKGLLRRECDLVPVHYTDRFTMGQKLLYCISFTLLQINSTLI